MSEMDEAVTEELDKKAFPSIVERMRIPPRISPLDKAIKSRIAEIQTVIKKERFNSRSNGFANGFLVFSQFIIGGLLASSFLKETLPSSIVGWLGLIVLLSSLVRQYYLPEVQSSKAKDRETALKRLVRDAEDQLALSNDDHIDALIDALPKTQIL